MARLFTWLRILILVPWIALVVTARRLRGRRTHAASRWLEEFAIAVLTATVRIVQPLEPSALRAAVPPVPRLLLPYGVRNESTTLADMPAETSTPAGWTEDRPTILYLHGGGYGVCSPRSHRELIARLAHECGARCIAVTYRLAPDHPYPAAIEDAHSAFLALLEDVPADRLFIAGDSAGGGLSIATLITLRDSGDPLPGGAILMSPWVDHTHSGGSIETNAATDYLTRSALEAFSSHYLGDHDPKTPRASPVFANLAGLPPLLIQAGGAEMLRDEIEAFAARASEAGVDVICEVEPGMVHVHQSFARIVPQSRDALRRAGAWLNGQPDPPRST